MNEIYRQSHLYLNLKSKTIENISSRRARLTVAVEDPSRPLVGDRLFALGVGLPPLPGVGCGRCRRIRRRIRSGGDGGRVPAAAVAADELPLRLEAVPVVVDVKVDGDVALLHPDGHRFAGINFYLKFSFSSV